MFQDPIIKRIRETRVTISKMFDHSPKKYIEFLKNKEKKHPERLAKNKNTQYIFFKSCNIKSEELI